MECRGSLGLGHCRRQLRHLPQPHHGSLHRMPGKPGFGHERGVHGSLGYLQCEPSPPLTNVGAWGVTLTCHSTLSTSTASPDGSRRARYARSTTGIGSSKSTDDERLRRLTMGGVSPTAYMRLYWGWTSGVRRQGELKRDVEGQS